MEVILQRLQQTQNWKELMRSSCRLNGLNTSYAGELTILKLKLLNDRFQKSYDTLREKISYTWIENQLKAFNWLLIAISALEHVKIEEFNDQHWQTLIKIFRYKTPIFLKFEGRRLISGKNKKNKNWSEQQNDLLKTVLAEYGDTKIQWNEIARKIYERSHESIFRTGKHCRERWLNYLDPSKERGAWTTEEDLQLLNKVYQTGKKWSQFACVLKRTEHTVKNRYNSLIIKQKKLTPEIKKQQKLILQAKKRIQLNQEEESSQNHQTPPQHSQPLQLEEKPKQPEDKIVTEQDVQDNKEKPVKQNNLENQQMSAFAGLDGLQQYVRQDLDFKNNRTTEFQPIYSPYWTYSPNPTPTNFLNSSPSPLSYYMGFGFANCISHFTQHLNILRSNSTKDEPAEGN